MAALPMTLRASRATAAVGAVSMIVAAIATAPSAAALERPTYDPALVPADGEPEPPQPMRQSAKCMDLIALPEPDVAKRAPAFDMLNVEAAWQYSTGNGVTVAVVDTGVNPSEQLPVIPGGDYVGNSNGLSDCDAHGTVVASIIAARPMGGPVPRPLPPTPAFHLPEAAPVTSAEPPALGDPAPPPPPPPPPAQTVTVVQPPPPPAPPPPPPPPEGMAPASGQGPAPEFGPVGIDAPAEPPPEPPPPPAGNGVVGVAPHATIISIRQSSQSYSPVRSSDNDPSAKAGNVESLAKAIVHAANMGAKVINISVTACTVANAVGPQGPLGAAIWYAAEVKDAVIISAAGNVTDRENCKQNTYDPMDISDLPRQWNQTHTVVLPAWFSDYVLSVGAVDGSGAPIEKSMRGPWVGVAGPGIGVTGLSSQTSKPVNAIPPLNELPAEPIWGTSYSAAYVSGIAALVRAKYPELSAHQVINRIIRTAHNPPGGVDNAVGYGLVDPVAALTQYVSVAERVPPGAQSRVLHPAPPPPPPDHRARNMALISVVVVGGIATLFAAVGAARRRRKAGNG